MFHAAKDALASRTALTWLNHHFGRYGTVQKLKIDSRRKTVEVCCLLDGEPTPITIRIENYALEADGPKQFIRATRFICTRPWLQNILSDYGPRQRIALPGWAAAAL